MMREIIYTSSSAGCLFRDSHFYSGGKKDEPIICHCSISDWAITTSVIATGLNNPRGLKFGPDDNLYVAEGGTGGTHSSIGACTQVLPLVGPYTGSPTGSDIVEINRWGTKTIVADSLPSSQTSASEGGLISGVADIAFIGNTLYGMLVGAGCSHGVLSVPNGVFRVLPHKKWEMIANLSDFIMNHPVFHPPPLILSRTAPGSACNIKTGTYIPWNLTMAR